MSFCKHQSEARASQQLIAPKSKAGRKLSVKECRASIRSPVSSVPMCSPRAGTGQQEARQVSFAPKSSANLAARARALLAAPSVGPVVDSPRDALRERRVSFVDFEESSEASASIDEKTPLELDEKCLVLDEEKPLESDGQKPLQLDEEKPLQLDEKKPLQLDEKKPLQLWRPVPLLDDADEIDADISEIRTPMSISTPHALTNAALERSELLLAQLSALGLDEDGDETIYSMPDSESGAAGSSTCSSPASRSPTPRVDTVELPVAVVDMLMEAWAKHRQQEVLDSQVLDKEQEVPEKATARESPGEPEPEDCSTNAPSEAEHCDSSSCYEGGSLLSGHCTPQSTSFGSFAKAPRRMPFRQTRGLSPAPLNLNTPRALPTVRCMQRSPMSGLPSPMHQGFLLPSPLGRCSPVTCTVQQTITITNTVRFH